MQVAPQLSGVSSSESAEALPSVDIFDWLLFPIFLSAFFGTLLCFDVLERIFHFFGKLPGLEKAVRWLDFSLVFCLKILGTKIEIQKPDNLPIEGPLIVVSNHQSLFDIPLLYTVFAQYKPRFIAKKELARWIPGVSYNLRNGGNALIDRASGGQAIKEIVKHGRFISEQKVATVIFPEGTRARRGVLKPLKPGGLIALAKSCPNAKIVPVALDGLWQLAARPLGPIPRSQTVRVKVGVPFEIGETVGTEGNSPLLNRCHEEISTLLSSLRTSHSTN